MPRDRYYPSTREEYDEWDARSYGGTRDIRDDPRYDRRPPMPDGRDYGPSMRERPSREMRGEMSQREKEMLEEDYILRAAQEHRRKKAAKKAMKEKHRRDIDMPRDRMPLPDNPTHARESSSKSLKALAVEYGEITSESEAFSGASTPPPSQRTNRSRVAPERDSRHDRDLSPSAAIKAYKKLSKKDRSDSPSVVSDTSASDRRRKKKRKKKKVPTATLR